MTQNYNPYYPQNAMRGVPASPNTQPIIPPQMGLKGRPVSSVEEARASIIDFDGSVFFFPDLANQRIYTKQINMDGTATLNMYELKEMPALLNSNVNYVTREEFEEALKQIQNNLFKQTPPSSSSNVPQQKDQAPTYSF